MPDGMPGVDVVFMRAPAERRETFVRKGEQAERVGLLVRRHAIDDSPIRIRRKRLGQDLQRHLPVQLGIGGLVDLPGPHTDPDPLRLQGLKPLSGRGDHSAYGRPLQSAPSASLSEPRADRISARSHSIAVRSDARWGTKRGDRRTAEAGCYGRASVVTRRRLSENSGASLRQRCRRVSRTVGHWIAMVCSQAWIARRSDL